MTTKTRHQLQNWTSPSSEIKLELGDLVRVRYIESIEYPQDDSTLERPEIIWTEAYHGVIIATSDMDTPLQMFCSERGQVHVLSPSKDSIELISPANLVKYD